MHGGRTSYSSGERRSEADPMAGGRGGVKMIGVLG